MQSPSLWTGSTALLPLFGRVVGSNWDSLGPSLPWRKSLKSLVCQSTNWISFLVRQSNSWMRATRLLVRIICLRRMKTCLNRLRSKKLVKRRKKRKKKVKSKKRRPKQTKKTRSRQSKIKWLASPNILISFKIWRTTKPLAILMGKLKAEWSMSLHCSDSSKLCTSWSLSLAPLLLAIKFWSASPTLKIWNTWSIYQFKVPSKTSSWFRNFSKLSSSLIFRKKYLTSQWGSPRFRKLPAVRQRQSKNCFPNQAV